MVWSVTQVWVPGHTTLEHDFLQSPWYMTSRSGCPMQRAISKEHSSLYDFPSLPHTACFREMCEQSGEHTHWGLPNFILQTFPGLHLTPSQVSLHGLQDTIPRKPSRLTSFMGRLVLDHAVSRRPPAQHSSLVTPLISTMSHLWS